MLSLLNTLTLFPPIVYTMASTTPITTAGSSSQKPVDDPKKVTENEQIPNSNTATSPIDDLLKTALGGKKLNQLSAQELNELLNKVDFLGAIGLDTEGKKRPNKGDNNNSSPISSPTAKTAATVSLPDLVGSFGTINLPTTVDFGGDWKSTGNCHQSRTGRCASASVYCQTVHFH
jgi:hypothetical protein